MRLPTDSKFFSMIPSFLKNQNFGHTELIRLPRS